MGLTKQGLINFYAKNQFTTSKSLWIEPEKFFAQYPGYLMPVVNGKHMSSMQIRTVNDIDNVKSMYIREAHREFQSTFGTDTKEFMRRREYTQSMFEDLNETAKFLAKVDDSWKLTKVKVRDSVYNARSANKGKKRMSTSEADEVVKQLQSLTKTMQEYLDIMSKINAGYGYSASPEAMVTEKGIPIEIGGAAKTSMERAYDFVQRLEKELGSTNQALAKVKSYSKGESPYILQLKNVKEEGKKKGKTWSMKSHKANDHKQDMLSTFEGYLSSIKGELFEGIVARQLGEHVVATQEELRRIMMGTGTGESVGGHTKKVATADIQYPDPLDYRRTIGVSVKNQPSEYRQVGSNTTSILTTGMDIGAKLVAPHSAATEEALKIMYSQSYNNPQKKSSNLNQMMSTALMDYAIAGAGRDRVHLMAFREGVMPYPDFLEKAITGFGLETSERTERHARIAAEYIREIFNGGKPSFPNQDFLPSLKFSYTKTADKK